MGYDCTADAYDQLLNEAHGLPGNGTPRGDKVGFPTEKQGFTQSPLSPTQKFESFPVDTLPRVIREFTTGLADCLGANPVFTIWPALACVAAAIGSSHRIRVKPGFEQYLGLWMAMVALSGSGKSPTHSQVMSVFRAIEDELIEAHEQASSLPEVSFDDEETEPAKEVPRPRLAVSDVTTEALLLRLRDAKYGLLLEDDELSGWLAGFDKYRSGRGSDRSYYLKMYDAAYIDYSRKGRKGEEAENNIRIKQGLLSICGGVQPGVLSRALSAEDHESGLAARFAFVMPPDEPLRWTDNPLPDATAFADLIRFLIMQREAGGVVKLDPEARELMQQHYNACADGLKQHQGPYRASLAKSAGRVARLALVFHCADGAGLSNIKADVMARAIQAGKWIDNENRRIFSKLFTPCKSGNESKTEALLAELKQNGEMTPYEIHRWNRSDFSTSDDAERFLIKLEQDGVVQRTVRQTGGKPKIVFSLRGLG